MGKFCKKCGTKVDEITGKCPNCDPVPVEPLDKNLEVSPTAIPEAPEKKKERQKTEKTNEEKKKNDKEELSKSQKARKFAIKVMVIILVVLILASAVIVSLAIWGPKSCSDNSENSAYEDYTHPAIDIEEYYSENSTIIEKYDVKSSNGIMTEQEAYNLLSSLGFSQAPIFTNYSIDGEFYDDLEISSTSDDKHPMYITNYESSCGEYWTIFLIDDTIIANPTSYNFESGNDVRLTISENETVISYDCETNTFFETDPFDTTLIVKTVDKIDSNALDKLTVEEINKL